MEEGLCSSRTVEPLGRNEGVCYTTYSDILYVGTLASVISNNRNSIQSRFNKKLLYKFSYFSTESCGPVFGASYSRGSKSKK